MGAVDVAARVVGQQVEQGLDAERREAVELEADPGQPADRHGGQLAECDGAVAHRHADRRLFDAEQVGVQGLSAVVHLGRDPGAVLAQPLGDRPRVGRGGSLALDDGHDLVVVGHEHVEQAGGRLGDRRLDGLMPSRAMPRKSPSAMGPTSHDESRTAR